MKILKEQTDYTDEEIMRIACEDWEHIMDGGVLAAWGKDILDIEIRKNEQVIPAGVQRIL